MLEEFKRQNLSVRQFALMNGFAVSTTQQVIAGTYPKMETPLAKEIIETAKGYLHPVTVPVFVHELDPSRAPWGLCPMCGLADTRCWCGYVESNNEGVR